MTQIAQKAQKDLNDNDNFQVTQIVQKNPVSKSNTIDAFFALVRAGLWGVHSLLSSSKFQVMLTGARCISWQRSSRSLVSFLRDSTGSRFMIQDSRYLRSGHYSSLDQHCSKSSKTRLYECFYC